MKEIEGKTEEIAEPVEMVSFPVDDRIIYGVMNYDNNEMMAEISGYDLRIAFNMRVINSLADAEACANAMADVFYQALMEQLIAENAAFIKPTEG